MGKRVSPSTSATLEDRLSLTRMAIESGDRELAERELAYYERNSEENSEEARILRLHLTASEGVLEKLRLCCKLVFYWRMGVIR